MLKAGSILALFVVVSIAIVGCGGQSLPGPEPQPVHGKLIYRGRPAHGFRVAFHPLGAQKGPRFAPSAMTDENGEFHLQSYRPGDGAPIGDYAVTFEAPQASTNGDPNDAPQFVDQLHGKLNNPATSKFKVTVREGENQLEPFDVK